MRDGPRQRGQGRRSYEYGSWLHVFGNATRPGQLMESGRRSDSRIDEGVLHAASQKRTDRLRRFAASTTRPNAKAILAIAFLLGGLRNPGRLEIVCGTFQLH